MKNDDEYFKRHHPFSRMDINDETKARFQWSSRRQRGLQELMTELLMLRQYHEGQSIHFDPETKIGFRYAIDEIRALIAMIPARDEDELRVKCVALSNPAPVVSSHELLPVMARASICADVFRLKPTPLPEWLEKWIIA
ncbi:hypothetical protein [uncultured Rhodoblastus sp.]|uniref:hypothetical protein n=1 Tax=uncultured Rhodoblastus sp. TaxID=543037 RepID=UPI0025F1BB57|nr:hypothetical protein [uncultured Rhodoblastus sp.]